MIKNENVLLRKIGDVWLLVPIKRIKNKPMRNAYYINSVGAYIWNHISSSSMNDLLKSIKTDYKINDEKSLEQDVYGFVKMLTALGFVKLDAKEEC